jgi:type I restriction enzyme S subunit
MRNESGQRMLRWAHLPECATPPDGWRVETFTNIATVIAGRSPPSETYNEKGVGLPFLQGNGDFSFVHPVPTLWCTAGAKVAIKGDTLISVRAPVGEMNRANQDYAIGRGLAAIRATGCNVDFLHHALQRWRWPLKRVAQGTLFDAVTARHFAQLSVCLPRDPVEQAIIAGILDAVDTALDRTRAAVERTRELKRACLQRFFYDALGETAYADRPRKRLPRGWTLLPTQRVLAEDPKNGLSPQASAQPPGIPTFSIAAIRNGRVDLETREHLKYANIGERFAEHYRIRRGDVLIVRGNANPDLVGTAGMVERFPKGCIYPEITMRLTFRSECDPMVIPGFAVLAWNHAVVHNQVLRRAKTSNGTLKINSRDVSQIVMPVPPEQEQAEICSIIRAADASIDALSAVGRAQQELKKSLMHALLTGRVRVLGISKAAA